MRRKEDGKKMCYINDHEYNDCNNSISDKSEN